MKEVFIVASCGITLVLVLGSYYDAAMRYYYPVVKSVSYVDCSMNIVNMARKINVTLTDRCVIDDK